MSEVEKLNSREDYRKLKLYTDALAKNEIRREQIPEKYRIHIPERDELVARRVKYNRGVKKAKEQYEASSTSKAMNLLGNAVSSALTLPLIGVAGNILSSGATAESAPSVINYSNPLSNKELAKKVGLQFATSMVGGKAVEDISNMLTGQSFGGNLYDITLGNVLSPSTSAKVKSDVSTVMDFLNPGYMLSPIHINGAYDAISSLGSKYINSVGRGVKGLYYKFKKSFTPREKQLFDIRSNFINLVYPRQWGNLRHSKIYKSYQDAVDTYRDNARQQRRHQKVKDIEESETTIYPFRSRSYPYVKRQLSYLGVDDRDLSPKLDPELKTSIKIGDETVNIDVPTVYRFGNDWTNLTTVLSEKGDFLGFRPENLNVESPYFYLPERISNYIKDKNAKILQRLNPKGVPGIKSFGSSSLAEQERFPTTSADFDVIVTRDFYNKYIEGKFPTDSSHNARFGKSIIVDGDVVDVNIIEQDEFGNATGKLAEQIFHKEFPEQFQQSLLSENSSKVTINKTPEELLNAHDPVTSTLLDASITDKPKAFARWPIYIEEMPTPLMQNVINRRGRMLFGKDYKDFSEGIDFSNIDANLQFLKEIGYPFINRKALASNPERMRLVLEDYLQGITGTGRGSRTNTNNAFYNWSNAYAGGTSRGAGLNTVQIGNSGYGPFYQFSQLDYGNLLKDKNPLQVLETVRTFARGFDKKLDQSISKQVNNILKKYELPEVESVSDLNETLLRAYSRLKTNIFDNLVKDLKTTELPGIYSLELQEGVDNGFIGAIKLIESDVPMRFSSRSFGDIFNMTGPLRRRGLLKWKNNNVLDKLGTDWQNYSIKKVRPSRTDNILEVPYYTGVETFDRWNNKLQELRNNYGQLSPQQQEMVDRYTKTLESFFSGHNKTNRVTLLKYRLSRMRSYYTWANNKLENILSGKIVNEKVLAREKPQRTEGVPKRFIEETDQYISTLLNKYNKYKDIESRYNKYKDRQAQFKKAAGFGVGIGTFSLMGLIPWQLYKNAKQSDMYWHDVVNDLLKSNAPFIKFIRDYKGPSRRSELVPDLYVTKTPDKWVFYPESYNNINGKFDQVKGEQLALERGDVISFSPDVAKWFLKNYKRTMPVINNVKTND